MSKKPGESPKGGKGGSSQELHMLSSAESNDVDTEQERRSRLRLSFCSEQFKLHSSGKVFSVLDLSHQGMALRVLDPKDFILLTVGAEIEGLLNLAAQKLTVRARVKHLTCQSAGCEFEKLDPSVRASLEAFLAPAAMGQAMRLMPSVDSSNVWYHGTSGTDLLLSGVPVQARSNQPAYRKMTLYARGAYVQWDHENGLSTGLAESDDHRATGHGESWGVIRSESTLMRPDPALDHDKLSIAKALILGSKLPPELKNWCLNQLTTPPPGN